jgi:hypothetical protein
MELFPSSCEIVGLLLSVIGLAHCNEPSEVCVFSPEEGSRLIILNVFFFSEYCKMDMVRKSISCNTPSSEYLRIDTYV